MSFFVIIEKYINDKLPFCILLKLSGIWLRM